jgi:hypothetical protein
MALVADIVNLWRHPGPTMRAKLAAGPREDRALAVLMAACGLGFVAQWPRLARAAHLDPSVPLDARLGGALMGAVFLLPLVAYAVAAASHLAARALGGRGSFFGARLALFWALLAAAPLMLAAGLVGGLAGPAAVTRLVGVAVFAAFAYLWMRLLVEAERWT